MESLTARRTDCLNKSRQEFGFKNVSTADERIICVDEILRKPKTF